MMTLGDWFIAAGTLLYLGAAASYLYQGSLPQALIYICYTGANAGLIWAAHWRT